MKIGIDIDGVLANIIEPYVQDYNQRNNTHYKYSDITTHSFWEVFNITKEEAVDDINEFIARNQLSRVLPVQDSQKIIALASKHSFITITSRPTSSQKQTLFWLEKHFPKFFDKIIFTNQFSNHGAATTKPAICTAEKINIMIEDHEAYANECAAVCERVLLINQP